MKIFEGKSPSERNKLIAAMVLGGLALVSLIYTFSGMFVGGKKTTVTVNVSPSPSPSASSSAKQTTAIQLPPQDQMNEEWVTTPVVYLSNAFGAPEAGRNIFAFYEPAAPTPWVAIPIEATPMPTPPPPTPTPTPPFTLAYVSPQSVYAGSKSFRLEANGDQFTPDAVILWAGSQLPTNYISGQKLTADIPANLIASEGQQSIEIRSRDGAKYSLPVMLNVQAPPQPNLQYIGAKMAQRSNNNTAYLQEPNKPMAVPFGARLNDVVGGRFRMVSISVEEVILEDTSLGFRHKLPLSRAQAGTGNGAGNGVAPGGQPTDGRGGFRDRQPGRFSNEPPAVYNPTLPTNNGQPDTIPGIPSNIPRYVPPTPPQKKDVDDDEDGDN